MKPYRYRVGIDVGLNSVGVAAVAIDAAGHPTEILNAQSWLHDGGIDPNHRKTNLTRLAIAGTARRTRRLYRERKRRLRNLDSWLIENGYPLPSLEDFENPREPWLARAELAEGFIDDESLRKEKISIALRHMARHRGWRSPYVRVEALFEEQPRSELFNALRERIVEKLGKPVSEEATQAQLISALGDLDLSKLRYGKDGNGLLGGKLEQRDNAYELMVIARVQKISDKELKDWIRQVFKAKSPRGSYVELIGKDALPGQEELPRASKAHPDFQRYRVAAVLANVRIKPEGESQRPLTMEERAECFETLLGDRKTNFSWADIANLLGVEKNQLTGAAATSRVDDEPLSAHPPVDTTDREISSCKIKPLKDWWENASEAARVELIEHLADGSEASEEVSELFHVFTEEDLVNLEKLNLSAGRAAYSADSLRRLTDCMMSEGVDLYEARRIVFGVPEDWEPPAAPIWQPLRNPAVDRVLKIVNRWLQAAVREWGEPESINIEHVREGFVSNLVAEDFKRSLKRRETVNKNVKDTLKRVLGDSSKVRSSDIKRWRALQRQNCMCAYCGSSIDFTTAEMDHIVPRKGVGSNSTMENLLATCIDCNRQKSNQLFSVWAASSTKPGVSLVEALKRVDTWNEEPDYFNKKQFNEFKRAVKARLKRKQVDPEFDSRSIESVAWMARELRHRIKGAFPSATVRVFRGQVTSEARKCSGFERQMKLIGGRGKTRFDRRHHAMDALVISMMRHSVAQTLIMRSDLRSTEYVAGNPVGSGLKSWKEYCGASDGDKRLYHEWREDMEKLLSLTNDYLDADRVAVNVPLRLKLADSKAHDDTVSPLNRSVRVKDEMSADLIAKSAIPGQWVALTRHPDYSEKYGLPADDERTLYINGRHLGPEDTLEFFKAAAVQKKVREGAVAIGDTIHHARIYLIKGKKPSYGMVRVFADDLLAHQKEDLFSVELKAHSSSMRFAHPKVSKAIIEGNAELLGVLVVGDEIIMDTSNFKSKDLKSLSDYIKPIDRWQVSGFGEATKIKIRPRCLSSEGLERVGLEEDKGALNIFGSSGVRVAVQPFMTGLIKVVRRDALGREIPPGSVGRLGSWAVE
ncbi:HNH endonuclease [Actinomycetaceae bacterium TAE3-ERU4]|nr:HNH endonuclease [Actinomycetaceae bacterium TAE3-ERU4]